MMPDMWGPPSAAEVSATESENAKLRKRVKEFEAQNAELLKKVEQLQAERDAVVETIKQLKRCADCKHATIIDDGAFTWVDCPKRDGRCSAKSLWEWRGVAEEE